MLARGVLLMLMMMIREATAPAAVMKAGKTGIRKRPAEGLTGTPADFVEYTRFHVSHALLAKVLFNFIF